MHPVRLAVLALLLCLPLAGAEEEGSWARFRGPNGTGVATGGKLPLSWDKPHLLWKVALAGEGNGSPIIWGEQLYLTTASGDGTARHLLCLDVKDGRQRWKKTYAAARGKYHRKNSLASATPCTDGERVYCSVWDGSKLWLTACDGRAGQEVWRQDLGPFRSQHGAGHSPIVFQGKVYLVNDHDQGSEVRAFNAVTGKPLWSKSRKVFNACYSTPFVRDNGSGTELVVATTAGVTGYDADSGKVNWNWDWDWSDEKKELRTVGSPVAVENLVIATSGDGGGSRCAVGLKLGGTGELGNNALAWKSRRLVPYVPTLVAWDGHLYFVNDQGVAGCLTAATGELCWSRRVCGPVTASPILVDGKLLAIDEEGQAIFLQATPKECKLLGRQKLGEPVFASPAMAGGKLFLRGKDHLFCIGTSGQ